MPIYEYVCNVCGNHFEVQRRFGETGSAPCPAGHRDTHRVFSPPTIVFKGSGFYVTDYRKGGSSDNGHGNGKSEEKEKKAEGAKAKEKTPA
ncbi:MAG: zinc ribbon domain-containing protein [Anaerolineae bacterium]|nr:zinc ribbon domain-containing protein [Anaerolineae bacterium]